MINPDVVSKIINKTLQNNSLLSDLFTPENKSVLLNNGLIRPVSPGEILCHQGQVDDKMLLIVKGEVEVSVLSNGGEKSIATLGAGELVGEISALFSVPRIANVVVIQPTIVFEIPANVFWEILRANPFAKDEIIKRSRKRIIETSLRCVPLFADLDNQSMSELTNLSSLLKIDKNTIVANEGKVERSMFVISSGTARVSITMNGTQFAVAMLHPGDYFGEYSLFSGDARSASVTAVTDLQLVEIKGESFQSFVDYYAEIGDEIMNKWVQRCKEQEAMRDNLNHKVAESRLDQIEQLLDV